jgi:hypothetical protein
MKLVSMKSSTLIAAKPPSHHATSQ